LYFSHIVSSSFNTFAWLLWRKRQMWGDHPCFYLFQYWKTCPGLFYNKTSCFITVSLVSFRTSEFFVLVLIPRCQLKTKTCLNLLYIFICECSCMVIHQLAGLNLIKEKAAWYQVQWRIYPNWHPWKSFNVRPINNLNIRYGHNFFGRKPMKQVNILKQKMYVYFCFQRCS